MRSGWSCGTTQPEDGIQYTLVHREPGYGAREAPHSCSADAEAQAATRCSACSLPHSQQQELLLLQSFVGKHEASAFLVRCRPT